MLSGALVFLFVAMANKRLENTRGQLYLAAFPKKFYDRIRRTCPVAVAVGAGWRQESRV